MRHPEQRYRNTAIQYIDSHLAERITLQALAEQSYLSIYHYAREFKKEVGISPIQFVIQRKLEIAGRLLKETAFTVNEISVMVGYESAQFSNLFRQHTGVTPTFYRKTCA